MRFVPVVFVVATSIFLISCSGNKSAEPGGGYYGGDAPPSETRDYDSIPDAVPKIEPLSKTGNKPYEALGNKYVPLKSSKGFVQSGTASWYGKKFHGRRTSSGEAYDMWAMTAAHPVLPLPTYVQVTSLDSGKQIVVKVNDRGPFLHDRIIDLSYAAAHKLGIAAKGTGQVKIEALDPSSNMDTYVDTHTYESQSGIAGSEADDGSDSSRLYFIQVGAFSDKINVLSMRDKLRNLGYTVYPDSVDAQFIGNPPFKVKVGPYNSSIAARTALGLLELQLDQSNLLLVK